MNASRPGIGKTEPVLPFDAIDRTMLPVAGGKAANLGELSRAGLPVPDGFCVTTAAYGLVAEAADLAPILNDLAGTRPDDTTRLAELARRGRTRRTTSGARPGRSHSGHHHGV
jgi:phosphoenolpyruvate synthase/pyruvate phosphate dikinase